jgi:hypothetical protein
MTDATDTSTGTDWEKVRRHRFSTSNPPDNWPKGVRPISLNGSALFGIDGKNEIYWDGEKLITERRWSRWERWFAGLSLFVASLGVGAAIVQAWAALQELPKPPV